MWTAAKTRPFLVARYSGELVAPPQFSLSSPLRLDLSRCPFYFLSDNPLPPRIVRLSRPDEMVQPGCSQTQPYPGMLSNRHAFEHCKEQTQNQHARRLIPLSMAGGMVSNWTGIGVCENVS